MHQIASLEARFWTTLVNLEWSLIHKMIHDEGAQVFISKAPFITKKRFSTWFLSLVLALIILLIMLDSFST